MSGAPIVVIDLETTGLDPERDEIVEVAIRSGLEPGAPTWTRTIRPRRPVPEAARAVHGLGDAELANAPSLAEVLPEIHRRLRDATVVVGYNVAFDLAFLDRAFADHGLPVLDRSRLRVVDPYRMWQALEPRTLAGASRRFTGIPLEDAHRAGADVDATARVLVGMRTAFDLDHAGWDELAALTRSREGRPSTPVLLFDGTCVLCNRTVWWVLARDRRARIRFAALGSPAGRRLLERAPREVREADSMVLVDRAGTHVRSEAVLRVAHHLGGGYRLAAAARVVPRGWRDAIYDRVARHRFGWFGRRDACRIPGVDERGRFLPDGIDAEPPGRASSAEDASTGSTATVPTDSAP